MAHVVADRVCETTTTTGTSNVTLAGAVAGFETFSAGGFANNDTCFYLIEAVDGNGVPTGEWEVGFGTYVSATPALARTTVIQSSNSDAAVTLSAGTKRVMVVSPGVMQQWGEISPAQLTANTNDWAPTGLAKANVIRFTTDASRNLTGLTGGYHNRVVYLHNVGSFNLVLTDEDTNSTAANRFALSGSLTVTPDMIVALQYDNTTGRWRSLVPSSQTINDLTEDTAPDINADFFVFYDASASTTDKVKGIDLRNALLGAGSATAGSWPIFGSGTLLTTPEAGAVERDANCFYATTDAGNRGYLPVRHFIRCNATRTLPNDTNENAIFNSPTNGRLTLETGTYLFEMVVGITSMSATSGNALLDVLGAGTATINDWLYAVIGKDGTLVSVNAVLGTMPVIQSTPASMFTAGTGAEMWFTAKGSFTVTVAGTLIPSIDQVTAAAAVVAIGSYFMCERIGDTGVVSVGQWD